MLNRSQMMEYALQICVPLMERTAKRAYRGELAFKADQVGFVPSLLENFCRPFWGLAPILAQGVEVYLEVEGCKITVFEYMRKILRRGLAHGEPDAWDTHKNYFRSYVYENQNITELAGVAIGIFFAREQLWEPLSGEEKDMLASELYNMAEVAYDHSWPNNHYWFPLLTITVLKRLGYIFARTEEMLEGGLVFLDSLYIGDGWYQDGAFGRFDYYEAWSLHLYPLLWTLIADHTFVGYKKRKEIYINRTNNFLEFFSYWFDAQGANVPFGRSLSYRFAACALFPVSVLAGCEVDPALAGRITAKNISYFKDNMRFEDTDILPEGYLYHTSNVVEGYTSDGGAYWCCKAFLALLLPPEHSFWNYENTKLSAEQGDYMVVPAHRDIHMFFEGCKGIVTMYNNTANYYQNGRLVHKFGNLRNWYSKFAYNSASGFACSCTENIAYDSMIALTTPDLAMTSHRLGIVDRGVRKYDTAVKEYMVLWSMHVPFSNDPETSIESWIIPMEGMHVRVHKVKLSQPYYVKEGGFALARWDDYCPKKRGSDYADVSNRDYTSVLKVASNVTGVVTGIEEAQAGYHLYGPLAAYPNYATVEPLEAGTYLFAAAFALCSVGNIDQMELPELCIVDEQVEIELPTSKIVISTNS